MKRFLLSTAALVLSASAAFAAPITGVTIFNYSTALSGFDRGPGHLVDGSGLTGGLHGNTPDGTMWQTNQVFGGDAAPFVSFNLNGTYNLASLDIWNYNESGLTSVGVASMQVETSLNGITWTSLGTLLLTQANGVAEPAQNKVITPVSAAYVRFDNMLSFNGDTNLGLSEVRFNSAAANAEVPEPASLALLGLGVAGLVATRRRARAAAAA